MLFVGSAVVEVIEVVLDKVPLVVFAGHELRVSERFGTFNGRGKWIWDVEVVGGDGL